jgi:hypothetical protein
LMQPLYGQYDLYTDLYTDIFAWVESCWPKLCNKLSFAPFG